MSGGVEGLFLVISHTFPIYKQLSTQGTITSCSLNKLDVKNHWVLRDLENPQALSSALAALRRYSPGPSSFLNPLEPWFLTSNYYIDILIVIHIIFFTGILPCLCTTATTGWMSLSR